VPAAIWGSSGSFLLLLCQLGGMGIVTGRCSSTLTWNVNSSSTLAVVLAHTEVEIVWEYLDPTKHRVCLFMVERSASDRVAVGWKHVLHSKNRDGFADGHKNPFCNCSCVDCKSCLGLADRLCLPAAGFRTCEIVM
jgi:hypothetical protein